MRKFISTLIVLALFSCSSDSSTDSFIDSPVVLKLKQVTLESPPGEVKPLYNFYYSDGKHVKFESIDEYDQKKYITEYHYDGNRVIGYDKSIESPQGGSVPKSSANFIYTGNLISSKNEYSYFDDETKTTQYEYNDRMQLISEKEFFENGSLYLHYQYEYYENGNLKTISDIIYHRTTNIEEYDDKENPYHYLLPSEYTRILTGTSKNNILLGSNQNYQYLYNNEGFPIQRTSVGSGFIYRYYYE